METSSRESRRPIGPIRKPRVATVVERYRVRNPAAQRDIGRPLPPEIQIVADDGVPMESLMSAIDGAPADVGPLEAVFGSGLIGEETYYQALAQAARLWLLQWIAAVRRGFRCGEGIVVRGRAARGAERRRPGRDRAAGGDCGSADRDDVIRPFAPRELRRHVAATIRRPRARASPQRRARQRARPPPRSAFREKRAYPHASRLCWPCRLAGRRAWRCRTFNSCR